jgi:hypothetical protein
MVLTGGDGSSSAVSRLKRARDISFLPILPTSSAAYALTYKFSSLRVPQIDSRIALGRFLRVTGHLLPGQKDPGL